MIGAARAAYLGAAGLDVGAPSIGFQDLFFADTYDQADGSTIVTGLPATVGPVGLTLAGAPLYRTGQAIFGGQPYIELTANTDVLYGALGNIAQPFVLVSFDLLAGAPAASRLMFDSYTDGSLPLNRVFWQYFDTIVDQSRLNAASTLGTGWNVGIGYNTETLWEGRTNGATSSQVANGTTIVSGAAGANSMDGLSIGQYTGPTVGSGSCETRRVAYFGRISLANWLAGRAEWVAWHNDKYGEAIT